MGVTDFSLELLTKHNLDAKGLKVLELGCQNLYNMANYGEISNDYFKDKGQEIDSIDLEGCNGSDIVNLDEPLPTKYVNYYDVITNFGTSEHCGNFYQTYKNIYDACKVGGIMICETPKTGNWKGHGNHYLITHFYKELCYDMDFTILELGEHPAMGNRKDGWNIYCVFRKIDNRPFVSEKMFNEYPFYNE